MKKLLLVDGHSLIHRAYHAYPKTLATGTGELTNAVYGFTNILLTAISEVQPTHLAVTFDLPKPTFRQTMFVGYKRSRVKPDDELITQIPRVKEVVKTLNIPIYEVEGFEADDVIGTLAKQAVNGSRLAVNVIILTSDRDLMQLIEEEKVVVKMPARGRGLKRSHLTVRQGETLSDIWNENRFTADWGFSPKLLPDYKALAGDQSDDIPGVKGIGEKTAKELVSGYGEINNIYRELFKGLALPRQGQALIKKLTDGQDSAQLSKKLATIDTDVPIKLDWEQTEIHEYEKEKVLKLFEELEFRSLSQKLPNDKYEQEVQEVLF
jgi:DNA polymerase-1